MPTLYSQRDPKWVNEKLGNSTTTIGDYGCTISCIGYCVDKNPSEVNSALKSVSGFQGNLVVWGAIQKAFPRVKSATRSRSWDQSIVLKAVSDYGVCLVEVDGAPIGGITHWIVWTDDGKLYDPWVGAYRNRDYYSPKGYTILEMEKSAENVASDKVYSEEEYTKVRLERDNNWNLYQTELGKNAELTKELEAQTKNADKLQGTITELETQISTLEDQAKVSANELEVLKTDNDVVRGAMDNLAGKLTETEIKRLTQELATEKTRRDIFAQIALLIEKWLGI